jgi:2-dehydro-3-deoxygluconokinase
MTDGPILALGEALVEFMPEPVGASMHGASQWHKFAGGGPATYAAAAVRCGHDAALITHVGTDPFSDFMIAALVEENVDVSAIRQIESRQIGLCFHECIDGQTHLIFHRRDSAATALTPADIDAEAIASAAALHVPGTTMQISASALETSRVAMATARAAGVPISFDPNIRSILGSTETADAFEEALASADVVTPTLEEAAAITGKEEAFDAARELRARGPKLVAVTLAAEGCVVLTEGDREPVFCPGYRVDVVEPTGAGDCHAAATMVGFLKNWDPDRIGAFANAAGAIAVTAMGHFGVALPTRQRIEALIEGNPAKDERVS